MEVEKCDDCNDFNKYLLFKSKNVIYYFNGGDMYLIMMLIE